MGQHRGLAGCLFLRVSHRAAPKVSVRTLVSCEDLTGGESTSKLTHVIVGGIQSLLSIGLSSLLAVGQYLCSGHEDLSTNQVTTWQLLAFFKREQGRVVQNGSPSLFLT